MTVDTMTPTERVLAAINLEPYDRVPVAPHLNAEFPLRLKGKPTWHAYHHEHDLLFDAIRNDKPYTETERSAQACLTAIMGRMACESGQVITREAALNSSLSLAPKLAEMSSLNDPPPASAAPDAQGRYPVAMPGRTNVL